MLSPKQAVPTSVAPSTSLALGKPEAGKTRPIRSPDPDFRPPTLGPKQGWGLRPGPTRSLAESATPTRAPRPKVRLVPPPRQLGGPGSLLGRSLPGAQAPPPAVSSPSPPPGREEEETPRPSLGPPGGDRSKPRARSAQPRRVGRPESAGQRPR